MRGAGELHGAMGAEGEPAVLLTKTGHTADSDTPQRLAHFLAWISYEGRHLCVNKQGSGIPESLRHADQKLHAETAHAAETALSRRIYTRKQGI